MANEKTLAEWRKEAGMTQQALASQVGCSKMYVYLIESGRRAPSSIVKKSIESAISEAVGKKVEIFERKA